MQRALAVDARVDPILHHVAPLGLAAAAGTALVVDLDPGSPGYDGAPTVAELLDDGVRRQHLIPERPGIAVMSSGGASAGEASELLEALVGGWPAIVVRAGVEPLQIPTVPVVPLYPPPLLRPPSGPAVYQSLGAVSRLPGPGIALPPLGRGRIADLIGGTVESRWRWVRAWRRVWELPWR